MTISKSHIIDQKAQNVFRDSLPPSWLIRAQKPDFHIDYFVEIEKGAEPSGLVFGVQLKGAESLRSSKDYIKQPIKTKHLAYYIDKVRQPVFIVVIDVTSRQGYWLFIQEWIRRELSGKDWRTIKKVSVRIPLDNILSDIEKLSFEVTRADKYMRDLWPGSIGSTILSKKAELESLDPRFTVDISYRQGRTTYNLLPNQNVKGSIQFSHSDKEELNKKMSDLIERGLPVKFLPNQIQITGTNLFQKLLEDFADKEVEFQTCRKVQCQFSIASLNEQKEEKLILYGVDGQISGGTREIRIETLIPNLPININGTLLWDDIFLRKPGHMNISFEPERWTHQHLLQLPYFDAVSKIVNALISGEKLKIYCEFNGNRLFSATSSLDDFQDFLGRLTSFISYLSKARDVSRRLGINPVLPPYENITDQDLETIQLLWTIQTEEGAHQKAEGAKVSFTLSPTSDFKTMITENIEIGKSTFLVLSEPNIDFLGYRLKDISLAYQYTNWSLSTESRVRIGNINEETFSQPILLEWIGTKDSDLIISLQKYSADGPSVIIFPSR